MISARKVFILFLALSISSVFGMACTSSNVKKDPSGDKPPFQLYRCGIAKYDNHFRSVYNLRLKLWKADRDVGASPLALKDLLELPGKVKDVNVGTLLTTAVSQYGKKLMYKAGTGVSVREGVKDPKAAKVAQSINHIEKTSTGVPKNINGSVEESEKLLKNGEKLTKDVPKDFTGMNALKAPRVTQELASSSAELGKVPAQVTRLTATSTSVAKQIPAILRSLGK